MRNNKSNDKNNRYVLNRFIIFSVVFFLGIVAAGSIAFMFSMKQIIRINQGNELSRMLEFERLHLETSVNSEIAIVLKLADSPLIKRFFLNPSDINLKKDAFEEMASYRQAFSATSIFWINDRDKIFYSDDNKPYWVDANDPVNYWYDMTLYETEIYNFNINYNPDIEVTKLWINAPVFDEEHTPIGMVGTGIELSEFLDRVLQNINESIKVYFFNNQGEIYGSRDISLVANKVNIADELHDLNLNIIAMAENLKPGETQDFDVTNGKIAICSIPSLNWYAIAFKQDSISDYYTAMTALFLTVFVLILLIFIIFNIFITGFLKSLRLTMESLENAKNEAEEASNSKSKFLATMSHEIRTPLNAIIGIAQIQMQQSDLPSSSATALEQIYSSGNNLLGIINDILDMSKVETGKLELLLTEYETSRLINDTVQLNIVRLGSKPIEFELSIDESLPSRLYGDDLRLKQILNNLLSNAIKYTEKGYVKLSISHSQQGEDITLYCSVEDTGQGIMPEDKDRIFSEYLRFNSTANRTTEGTGLGLSITRKLVSMMGGTIGIESVYGKGSIFTVTIKQKAVACPMIGAELAHQLRNFSFTDKQSGIFQIIRESMPYGSVLIVDDVKTNLYVTEGLLMPYKLHVETADSGFKAIDKVINGSLYDVIFMDHMMPQMDGIETTGKLREMGYNGAIVALTANALIGNDEMFAQKGFDGFISKPVNITQLNEFLNKFVRDRHPDEAKNFESKSITHAESNTVDPKVLQIFRGDAECAIETFRKTTSNGDLYLFTITAHAMKSALANIGEHEISKLAAALERAGLEENMAYIGANMESFIGALGKVIGEIHTKPPIRNDDADKETNTEYLFEQLNSIKAACEKYDDDTAYAILDNLKEITWTAETTEALEQIRDALFIYSDFDGVAEMIERFKAKKMTAPKIPANQ